MVSKPIINPNKDIDMDNIELHKLIDKAEEEFRVFERLSADTGRSVLDLLKSAINNCGKLEVDKNIHDGACYNKAGEKCPSGGILPKSGECYYCKNYKKISK